MRFGLLVIVGLLLMCAAPCAFARSAGYGLGGVSIALDQGDGSEHATSDRQVERSVTAGIGPVIGDGDDASAAPASGHNATSAPAPSHASPAHDRARLPTDGARTPHRSSWQSLLPGSIQ